MIRLFLFQVFKHQIHRILKVFIILADFHGVDELDQRGEVLLLHRRFIVNISDQRTVQQCFCLVPERISALSVTLGIGHQRGGKLQNVLFAVDIGERIIMHRLAEIDGIEDLDPVTGMHKGIAHLEQRCTLRICQYIRAVELKQVRFDPEPGLTGAGTAHDQNVFVPGVGRILRPVAHHQPLRFGKDNVVFKDRIHERFDVFGTAPPCGAILEVVFKIFGILPFQIDRQPESYPAGKTHRQIRRMKTRQRVAECRPDRIKERQQLLRTVFSLCQPPCFAEVRTDKACDDIGKCPDQLPFQLIGIHIHRACTLCLSFVMIFAGISLTTSISLYSVFRTLGRFVFFRISAE